MSTESDALVDDRAGNHARRVYGNLSNLRQAGFEVLPTDSKLTMLHRADVFTLQRLQEVSEVDAEIGWITYVWCGLETVQIRNRILRRLEAIREKLKEGMRDA